VTIALAVFDNVNGGCGQMKMGLCYNMNDKQCDNDNGNNNDNSDVMAKREAKVKMSRDTTDSECIGIYINSIILETPKYH